MDAKSITVIAWKRPDYLLQTLTALFRCPSIDSYHVTVSIDGLLDDSDITQIECSRRVAMDFPVRIMAHSYNLGVNYHPLIAHSHAFRHHNFNVVLEEDTVPSPDALELCDWYYSTQRSEYAVLNLHSASASPDVDPTAIMQSARFCPWGWATTKEWWEGYFRKEWNHKHILHPNGWDYSVGMTLQRHNLLSLSPLLSRCRNIGREGGVYETAEHWDEWAKDLVQATTTGHTFKIAGASCLDMELWARLEIEQEQKATLCLNR